MSALLVNAVRHNPGVDVGSYLENPEPLNTEGREALKVLFPSIALRCAGNIGMSSMSFYDMVACVFYSLR